MRLLGEDSARRQVLHDRPRLHPGRIELHADPQPGAADVGDERRGHGPEPVGQVPAEHGRTCHQLLVLEDVERFQADRRRQRVATEGRAVRPGPKDVHDASVGEEGRDRQEPAAERLAEDEAVRPDPLVLEGEHPPRPPEAGLDLVEQEQDPVPVAQVAQAAQEADGRDDDPGLALDRFD